MEKTLTEGPVFKKLLLFVLPILGSNLLQALYGTVDLMVVGLFTGAKEVSAVSTGSMTMQTITGIITGISMGSTIILGNAIGKKRSKEAAQTVASSLALFSLVSVFLTVGIVFSAPWIAKWMHAPQEAFSQTVLYIRVCGYGAVFIVFFNALSAIFRGIGDSKTPLLLMGISCIFNVIGDLILTGYFRMGSKGAAIATVAAQGVSVLGGIVLIFRNGFGFAYRKEDLQVKGSCISQVLRYGIPVALQELLTGISFMVILSILNAFGLVASAGVGVGEKICGIMFIVPGAMMSAVSAFSAQNVGAGYYDRAIRGMIYGIIITVSIGLGMFMVSFFHGAWLASFFSKEREVCLAAGDYLKSYSIDCVIVGFVFCMTGYLNGNGKTGFVALQGILSTFLVRIPFSYFMSKIEGVSLFQVGFATPAATIFSIVITTWYLLVFERIRKNTL